MSYAFYREKRTWAWDTCRWSRKGQVHVLIRYATRGELEGWDLMLSCGGDQSKFWWVALCFYDTSTLRDQRQSSRLTPNPSFDFLLFPFKFYFCLN